MYLFEEMNNTPPKAVKTKEKNSAKKEQVDPKKTAKLNDILKAFKTPIDDFETLSAEEPSVYYAEKPAITVSEEKTKAQEPIQHLNTNPNPTIFTSSPEKKVVKIVVFYEDKTFEEYKPNN